MESTNNRLGFIDAARSLAIILMLQGHFISLTFKDYTALSAAAKAGSSGYLLFDIWLTLRGFTAPLFFCITGLVFTYLLLREQNKPFWSQVRVRKGLRRGLEVMLWGYILCLNLENWHLYEKGILPGRTWTFHVLQSIGFSLFAMISLYGLARLIAKIKVSLVFLIFGLLILFITPFFDRLGDVYVPSNAHPIIQNMFNGPHSVFPIFPWLGMVLLGGAVGAIINERPEILKGKYLPLKWSGYVVLICLLVIGLIHISGLFGLIYPEFELVGTRLLYFSVFLFVLLVFLYLERARKFKIPFFISMGKNTLNIYILHTIILYGSVFGWGIRTYFEKDLSFSNAVLGALIFILFFGVLTQLENKLKSRISRRKSKTITQ